MTRNVFQYKVKLENYRWNVNNRYFQCRYHDNFNHDVMVNVLFSFFFNEVKQFNLKLSTSVYSSKIRRNRENKIIMLVMKDVQ